MAYYGKLLRINLTEEKISVEDVDEELYMNFIGGRGIGAKILLNELKPKIDPLSEDNKLIFATGPLTGSAVPMSGRCSLTSKSPLTNTVFDSNSGGYFGAELKKTGFDIVIIEGKAEKPVYIKIENENVEIKSAENLWGRSTSETTDALSKYGKVACIGLAGENLVRFANIINDGGRAFGRGGLGAVMGSKNLKAVVVRGNKKPKIANEYAFKKYVGELREILKHPALEAVRLYGTADLVNIVNKFGALPIKNFQYTFTEMAEKISGERLAKELLKKRYGCYACPVQCGRITSVNGMEIHGPEFESIWSLGANLEIFDLKAITMANHLCNELGIDTISMGGVIAFAMEAYEKGFIDEEIKWGDKEKVLELIKKTAERQGIGNLLAEGVARLSKELNADFAMHIKGLEMPAYDPRALRAMPLAYATSNRGACHLRAYTISQEVLGLPRFIPKEFEIAGYVKKLQDIFAALDSLIVCKLTTFATFKTLNLEAEIYAKLLTSATGIYFSEEELLRAGERIYNIERYFNNREGIARDHDLLPRRFFEPIPSGVAKGRIVENFERLLDAYYLARMWSFSGEVSEKKLMELKIIKEEKFPKLQVALDLRNLNEAIRIAEQSLRGGAHILEAGTPLIKMFGMRAVEELSRRFPNATIVADLKTMDTGYIEVEMAAQAGADIICILALASDETIKDALGAAKKYNVKVMADLIGIEDKDEIIERAKELEKLGVDYIIFHIGIDKQIRSDYDKIPFPILNELAKSVSTPIAVAGGLKKETVPKAIKAGAKIIIVGGAITRSSDPEMATKAIIEAMKN